MNKVTRKVGNFAADIKGLSAAANVTIRKRYILPWVTPNVSPVASHRGRYLVTMVPGIGSGPQMMGYLKTVFKAACVPVDFEVIDDIGDINKILTSIKKNGVAIKGTIPDLPNTAPNVTLRADLDLYVYIVHCLSYPNVRSRFSDIDIYVFRQNVEGEYAMLEHESRPGIVECLKIITEETTYRFAQWAYNFARKNRRKKVTIVHKANIMKLTDGLFLKTIEKVGKDYPEIETTSMIVDNCCSQIVTKPHLFDVILTPNLYGNIIISICCGLIGGYGLVSGRNYSDRYAVFEVGLRHIAFENETYVNPIAMINAGANLLRYLRKDAYANLISESIYKTLAEDKIFTPDLGGKATGDEVVKAIQKHIKDVIKECPASKKTCECS